ncbi:hypothetical protein Poli38472_001369 [Pythium oligandrum]|uniref:Uncharacterized protein n=1 Tax=Pythium oligandrum TaxID=41045 RepID=A0A8K1CUJ0_PYTOL|nr:hypothetical protein Poli38472_001369 [Pythium oligandrum]|eukprot:TMW69213.1 hypothetical protein Poli38472_001369 [Pythium oligandrum]
MVTASIAPAPDLTSDASPRTFQPTLTAKKLRHLWFVVFIVQLLYTFQLVMMADMYIRTSWRAFVPFLTFLTETFLVTNERRFITHYATLIGASYAMLATCFTGLLFRML